MRSFILLLFANLVFTGAAGAQPQQRVSIQTGETKSVIGSKLNVKFLSVVEDSRCPKNVACVWAGNAKITIRVWKKNQKPAEFDLNTGLDPKTTEYLGYRIALVNLSPEAKTNQLSTAVLEITKLKS
jgi:hypothetical protein